MIRTLFENNPLFVFALPEEAADQFDAANPLFAGVGKLNALYHVMKRIQTQKPGIIVNLGSAGSAIRQRGELVCCTRFVQRDMDVTALGFEKFQTPFDNRPWLLEYGLTAPGLPATTCGSGDCFEVNHNSDAYHVVDMEAFSIAWLAQQEQIPFLCLKYISDGADGAAAEEWPVAVHHAASTFRKYFEQNGYYNFSAINTASI